MACRRGRGGGKNQEDEEGAPPKQCALPEHSVQEKGGGGHEDTNRGPPDKHALPAHGMQKREGGGVDKDAKGAASRDKGRWGDTPIRSTRPLCTA